MELEKKTVYDPGLKANLSLDAAQRVRGINHFQEYWASDESSPLLAATDYLYQMADVFQVPKVQLKNIRQRVSFMEPMEQGVEYRLSEEKQLFDSTTVGFYQTYLNIPVWQAGFTVTVKHAPYRIVSSVNTSQEDFDASLPPQEFIEHYKKLFTSAAISQEARRLGREEEEPETADFVRSLVDRSKLKKAPEEMNDSHLIRGRFYVYRYDENNRLPKPGDMFMETEALKEPVLPLFPVSETIKHGQYYVVAEVTFSFTTEEYGHLNWLALVEVETSSVLYLRALVAHVNGQVFKIDPISSSGNAANTSDQSNTVLNPFRTSEVLPNLDVPVSNVQSLLGTYAHVTNKSDPNIPPPTEATGTDFNYDVRTNNFAAVNAYYHVDRFFTVVESLGFPKSTYFSNWTFPILVDHRACFNSCPKGIEINAYCLGNGSGGIDHVGYCLNDLTDTINPVGRACDSRVTWHELGGHGVLFKHVDSGFFGFSHSAGDSMSAIFHDPESQAPDRFRYAPWHPTLMRRFDRDVTAGWAWGGTNDDKGYGSEQILATTLFRIYQSIGGDSTALSRRQFASRMMLYLILRTISTFTSTTNPSSALDFANAMMAVDLLNWTSEGVYGGAYNKVIRWSFEKQGLYQAPGAPTPVKTAGQPPDYDVYIDDGRGGEYSYQAVHWLNTSIWNRKSPDGGTSHEQPILDVPNYAYVKIKTRGTKTANNVVVRGYHCKPSAGVVWPNDFDPFTTAQLSAGTLASNNTQEKIVGPFEWTPVINGYGHDCMLMIVSADGDPSNVDNFTLGEFIPDWRLVPNDNNIGQRNVNPIPGGLGAEGLMKELHGHSFWVGNTNLKTSIIELRVRLPEFLVSNDWYLSFKDIPDNRFELQSGKQREIVIELHPGIDFSKQQVEESENRDILITVHANDMQIGGMTYRIDPEISVTPPEVGTDDIIMQVEGDVTALFEGKETAFENEFWLYKPKEKLIFKATDGNVGKEFDVGHFRAGMRLVFALKTQDGHTYYTDKSLNQDGCDHVIRTRVSKYAYRYRWEDLWKLGDKDFDDLVVKVNITRPR